MKGLRNREPPWVDQRWIRSAALFTVRLRQAGSGFGIFHDGRDP